MPPNGGKLQTISSQKNHSSMDKEQFKSIVHPIMKANGFRRRGNSWYKTIGECIVLLNLQHSNWSSLYYINLACFLRKTDPLMLFPQEYKCPIRWRIPNNGKHGESYHDITDLENNMNDRDREEGIENILNDYCIPALNKVGVMYGVELREDDGSYSPLLDYENILNGNDC